MSGDKKAAAEEYKVLQTINPHNAEVLYVQIYHKQPPKN